CLWDRGRADLGERASWRQHLDRPTIQRSQVRQFDGSTLKRFNDQSTNRVPTFYLLSYMLWIVNPTFVLSMIHVNPEMKYKLLILSLVSAFAASCVSNDKIIYLQ